MVCDDTLATGLCCRYQTELEDKVLLRLSEMRKIIFLS